MGLLQPQSGKVLMDGVDIFSIPHQWARIIGYVPQSVFLIDDTVRSNVAFGLKKEEIQDEKVWEALGQAQLKEFVENLPYGLDTIVGERGVKFFGGQRQRIAIARALYEDSDILVLDEATSALDTETETAVMESIDAISHFSPIKKKLQHLGSWFVRVASNTDIPDAPSGFRAISRDAAMRLHVINEYTYTLETIIQADLQVG